MDDILAIVGIAATVGISAGLAMLLRWALVDRGDPSTHGGTLPDPVLQDWPVGIQEEEPFRWRVELLGHGRRAPVAAAGQARRTAPTPNPPSTALG